jgi:hypothetical protein
MSADISTAEHRVFGRAADTILAGGLSAAVSFSRPARSCGSSSTEVHSLVGHGHVVLYLYAAKSLKRFWPEAGIVVHDDGTLRALDCLLLRRQLRGVRIIRRPDADRVMAARLGDWPRIRDLRSSNVRILQLLDYYLLAASDRVIGMDSDVLFLAEPRLLREWASGAVDATALYSPERAPKGPHWIPDTFPGVSYVPDLCCGLVAIDRRRLPSFDYLERLVKGAPPEIIGHGRFVTQMLYSLLLGSMDDVRSLGEDYRSGRMRWLKPSPTRVAYHYFASHSRDGSLANLVGERHQFQLAYPTRFGRLSTTAYDKWLHLGVR